VFPVPTVFSEATTGVAELSVAAFDGETKIKETKTNGDGSWRLRDVPNGFYHIKSYNTVDNVDLFTVDDVDIFLSDATAQVEGADIDMGETVLENGALVGNLTMPYYCPNSFCASFAQYIETTYGPDSRCTSSEKYPDNEGLPFAITLKLSTGATIIKSVGLDVIGDKPMAFLMLDVLAGVYLLEIEKERVHGPTLKTTQTFLILIFGGSTTTLKDTITNPLHDYDLQNPQPGCTGVQ
jgi:hypothetical protein